MQVIMSGNNVHLDKDEALAVQALSVNRNWQIFLDYVRRQFEISSNDCRTVMTDHRFHQGRCDALSRILEIKNNADGILSVL